MNFTRFILRDFRYYRSAFLAIFAATVVCSAVLTGALILGDSVKFSLQHLTETRLGRIRFVLRTDGRYFRSELAGDLSLKTGGTAAPAMLSTGLAINPDNKKRISHVQVVGIDSRFPQLWETHSTCPDANTAVLSRDIAGKLKLKPGDDFLLRVSKQGLAPGNAPFVEEKSTMVAVRLRVKAIAEDNGMGRFSLNSNQSSPGNVFISLPRMAELMDLKSRANVLLIPGTNQSGLSVHGLDSLLRLVWKPADAALEIRQTRQEGISELRSGRIFIDEKTASEAKAVLPAGQVLLTYLANEFSINGLKPGPKSVHRSPGGQQGINPEKVQTRSCPYSFITAAPPDFLGMDPGLDGIILNSWLAADLGAVTGDSIGIKYFIMGPRRQLKEVSTVLVVKKIVNIRDQIWDPALMPDFPGMSHAGNCRDWETGAPIDLKKIRPKDEAYWREYRGTPKAFISLERGQKMWANPFGACTAIRFKTQPAEHGTTGPSGPGSAASSEQGTTGRSILDKLTPAEEGLFFSAVYAEGKASASQSTDFGSLFLSLGFFIILATLILIALMFSLHIQTRMKETAVLSAIGFKKQMIFRILFTEGLLLALAGGIAGAFAGILYNRLMLLGLNTIWQDAVGMPGLLMKVKPSTLVLGSLAGTLTAFPAMLIVLARNLRKTVWKQASATGAASSSRPGRKYRISLFRMALKNAALKRSRTITVIVLLALATFIIFITSANRRTFYGYEKDARSGTGGFACWAESSIALRKDPGSAEGIKEYDIREEPFLKNAVITAMQKLDGEDASCLNLNRASRPSILGVPAELFRKKNAFSFLSVQPGVDKNDPWAALQKPLGPHVLPAYADQTVITWGLQKKTGDTLFYTADNGDTLGLKLMGGLDNSIFQGSLLVSDSLFRIHFPMVAGYKTFVVSGPAASADSIALSMESVFADYGMTAVTTSARLAAFNSVENTYLSVFMLLGALGILIGTLGLGLVLLRNMMERRNELALYLALGYTRRQIMKLVMAEYLMMLLSGTFLGMISAAAGILPSLLTPAFQVPWLFLLLAGSGFILNGILWVWLPARYVIANLRSDSLSKGMAL